MEEFSLNIERVFESDINSIRLVEPIIYKIQSEIRMPETTLFNILIAVTEAVNNAIVHGNRNDPGKKVRFAVKANSKEMNIWVEDEGQGFNPEEIADPRSPENLLKSSGRGVFIIRELANVCTISAGSKGTIIYMKFELI